MIRYPDIAKFIADGLVADGNTSAPLIVPGTDQDPLNLAQSPNSMIFVNIGNGAGPSTEFLFDRIFISLAVAGEQRDYQSAADLANQVDRILLRVSSNTQIGAGEVLYIARTGGAPAFSTRDNAERYHFAASYITETTLGL